MKKIRPPDRILFAENNHQLVPGALSGAAWSHAGTDVTCRVEAGLLAVDVRASGDCAQRVVLRWEEPFPAGTLFLGDHWERGYGDLAWRTLVPERVMPWYFLAHEENRTTGWGVKTGAGSLCFWTVDAGGISLWLDLRNGTMAMQPGDRTLRAAEVVTGEWDGSPFAAAASFCRQMSPAPRLPSAPVYGGNDWYYSYGKSTHETILRDSATISGLAGSAANRPFSVIDAGWQFCGDANGAPWHLTNTRFPSMAALASGMRNAGCRPGIWTRPLLTNESVPDEWLLPPRGIWPGRILDPSLPEVLDRIRRDVSLFVEWGYDLVKHDFSTYDLFGKWGFEMVAEPIAGTWSFRDRTRTTAEIISAFYRALREAAGPALLLGCNTIGHLGAGLFELQRTGDDTSGRNWERTRRMGVNTLAFRMAQHDTFFAVDADCVGLTAAVPWELNRQWLDLLARSGTPLFVSAAPESLGPEQKAALREAFAAASSPREVAEPLDWLTTPCPEKWKIAGEVKTFNWNDQTGGSPFIMG